MIKTLKKWWSAKRLARKAKKYNHENYLRLIDATWMCPECGKIHKPLDQNPFVGYIYPACCSFPRYHRNNF